ncbi:MAG: phosphopyruvate hydratase [Actinobacteria bacterium]|nr:phosphopyruvate hydratase [Actinomycetota bacterium]
MKITQLLGYQVFDSRGKPTVAATLVLSDGTFHTARVPSGASTGRHEAKEIRDHETGLAESLFAGNSVYRACANINELIAPKLIGKTTDLRAIDQIIRDIDGTANFKNVGANAALAISIVVAKSQAHAEGKSLSRFFQPMGALKLPMPMVNILSGGAHAKATMDIQDVLVIPEGASSFREAISWSSAIREVAAIDGEKMGALTHLTADEGGLAIGFTTIDAACEFLVLCIGKIGLEPGKDVSLAIDFAATQFYRDGEYRLRNAGKNYTADDFISHVTKLTKNLPILSVEDPFAEDDWDSWQKFMADVPSRLQVIGDDLYTTNIDRLRKGIETKASNAILIKPNQNGLLTQTLAALECARESDFKTIVSARSGETEDSWLSDLAVGWGAEQIKVGSTHGSERTSKWNRLLELEATEDCLFSRPFSQS